MTTKMRLSKMLFFLCFRPTRKFQGGSPLDPLFEPPADPPLDSRPRNAFRNSAFGASKVASAKTPLLKPYYTASTATGSLQFLRGSALLRYAGSGLSQGPFWKTISALLNLGKKGVFVKIPKWVLSGWKSGF